MGDEVAGLRGELRSLVREHIPADFLGDFGFYPKRADGPVELARLELGGLVPVEEKAVERLLDRAKELLAPQPGHAPSRS